MPRPVARPLPPRPPAALPKWFGTLAVLAVVVVAAGVLLWKVNQTNQRLQAEHRLTIDPALGPWLSLMKEEIAAFESGGAPAGQGGQKLAEAVWLGRVRSLDFTTKQGEGPRLSDVILDPAHLVDGRRSPLDPRGDGAVRISVLGHRWQKGEPREGESWVFSVSRINKGNNVAHSAHPAP